MGQDHQSPRSDWEFRKPSGILTAAPLSAAVRVGDLIFVAGQIALTEDGSIVEGGVGAETRICLRTIADILEDLRASLADVVQTRIFLVDFSQYADFNEAYMEYFSPPYPPRATVGSAELALGALVEIEAVAIASRAERHRHESNTPHAGAEA